MRLVPTESQAQHRKGRPLASQATRAAHTCDRSRPSISCRFAWSGIAVYLSLAWLVCLVCDAEPWFARQPEARATVERSCTEGTRTRCLQRLGPGVCDGPKGAHSDSQTEAEKQRWKHPVEGGSPRHVVISIVSQVAWRASHAWPRPVAQ